MVSLQGYDLPIVHGYSSLAWGFVINILIYGKFFWTSTTFPSNLELSSYIVCCILVHTTLVIFLIFDGSCPLW
jgi:hypothetical protein